MFNFGDSNSETGGLAAAFEQAPWPNGETYFHYPAGRRCDGHLIIQSIAGSLGFWTQWVQISAMEPILPRLAQPSDLKTQSSHQLESAHSRLMSDSNNSQIFTQDHEGRILDKYGCATPFNKVAQYFNLGLKEAVVELKELPLAAITYIDIFTLKYPIITQAHKFGFEQPLGACCGHGDKYNFNNLRGCGAKLSKWQRES
ncbi:GDSL lipase/esterase [Dillenia turbinata]|uniref:GDSL lipase/esterase n=1 Tax=Dillenia turbinata TaxID=194707 RepID=A0AAN8ZDJ6_9MAGN